ncbi:MAG: 6-phosphogluconolactonase [Firmicutes bacterium HGW-Firmicutes-19]|jgi:6-phosphogluconolactonase|nr:MAG: 6-phosphogluconolactonase [Firmicutes bacterium HGW-Firmicutes-19]
MKITVGTYTKNESKGVYTIELHDKLWNINMIHEIGSPTYLAKMQDTLFTVVKNGEKGGIAAFRASVLVDQFTEEGSPPCFVSVIKERNVVMSANYHKGCVDVFTFDGKLHHIQKIEYVNGSKAHFIQYDPRYNLVFVCDLGLDAVYAYTINKDNKLSFLHHFRCEKGSGPRHLVVHPEEPYVYVLTELSSELLVLKLDKNGFELMSKKSLLPEGEDDKKWGAAIRITKDGNFIYASNRGHDSISVFETMEYGRFVKMIQNVSTEGIHPRDFNLSPDDEYLVVGNMESNTLTLFRRDMTTGKLSLLQRDVYVPEPVCILFD